jgi:hypothetical protein
LPTYAAPEALKIERTWPVADCSMVAPSKAPISATGTFHCTIPLAITPSTYPATSKQFGFPDDRDPQLLTRNRGPGFGKVFSYWPLRIAWSW